jgi:D-3-phosphoglycerate dehydrogenase
MIDRISLPKEQIRLLLLEGVHDSAVELLQAAGYSNISRSPKALQGAALEDAMHGVHMLGIRSRTQLSAKVLRAADRLLAIGCFCIGTNQVDLQAARAIGVPVFNAPFSNTRSVAELVIGEIIMLMRGILPRSASAHQGVWEKSSANSWEIRGKTLGIVGYGNIGVQLSVLAEACGMRVIYYDTQAKLPHGNVAPAESLAALLAASDVVSLHVPQTPETEGMIGTAELRAMRQGAFLINNSRGTVVDLEALAAALRDGHLLGAAIDVFPIEPASGNEPFRSPLQGLPNVLLTPHIGGSTAEAQQRIGAEVARKLIDYSDTGATLGAVNFPQVQLSARPTGVRYMHVHRNEPGLLRRINDVFANRGLNIAAEVLQTDGEIGYVVVEADSSTADSEVILTELRSLPGTIRARLLYERAAP